MKSKMFLWLFLLIIFFTPVSAKEEKYKIVSGDLETIGSEVCFDTECFYVIGNDGNNVKLFSKYNLYVGGYSPNNSEWYSYGDEATGIQDSNMKGLYRNEVSNGTVYFSLDSYWEYDSDKPSAYVYNENSNLYQYVENYVDYLNDLDVVISRSGLITNEELENLGCEVYSCSNAPNWIYSSSYWTGTSYYNSVWFVDARGIKLESEVEIDNKHFFGVRPVIEVPIGYFSEKGIFNGPVLKVSNSDGVISNDNNSVDVIFNDLEQEIKYQTTIYNNTDKALYVNDINLKNISEDFINVRLDSKSNNMMVESGGSSLITFYVRTLKEEGAGRNLNDNITINFRLSDKNLNPSTFSNIFEVFALIVILCGTIYFVRNNKSKKVKALLLVAVVSLLGINFVYADDFIDVSVSGKIKYLSQNNIISTGTVLNGKVADYTNSKEVWAYYDKVKNVEVKSIINEPKKYYKKFDLTENKTGRVVGYLVENGDKDTPYDLVIMSNGVVVANSDSSFMFSFPNTEKVDGLSNIDFRGATTMMGMFIGNEKLVRVDTKSIEMDNTTNTSFMFYDCSEIKHDRDDFNLENVNNDDYMIPHSLYNTIKKDAVSDKNEKFDNKVVNTGKYFMKDTKDDKFPIYYYRGDIKNNNVVFGGFCWKIVRTTDTGGVKLIYNGVVKENGSCQMSSDEIISIGGENYHMGYTYFSSTGYMSDSLWPQEDGVVSDKKILFERNYMSDVSYYYSDSVIYENGKYYLINSKIYNYRKDYKNLNGYYTCNSTSTSCSNISYLAYNDNNAYSYIINLSNGNLMNDNYIILSKNYSKKEGIYHLNDPLKILYSDWVRDYNKYLNYFTCSDFNSESCLKLYNISSVSLNYMSYQLVDVLYGNDVEYVDGIYTLKDVISVDSWKNDYEQVSSKYHYSCFNTSGKCSSVSYIFRGNEKGYDRYVFNDGMNFESFYKTLFESYDEDSEAKIFIDDWYKNNLVNYTNKLEDTVWCNDRSFYASGLKGKNESFLIHMMSSEYRYENDIVSLNCQNKSDRYTVDKKNGNGQLTYPIALITMDEAVLAGANKNYNETFNYLNSKVFWTMTPYVGSNSYGYFVENGYIGSEDIDAFFELRPSISLKNSLKYVTGNGTVEKPYVIE